MKKSGRISPSRFCFCFKLWEAPSLIFEENHFGLRLQNARRLRETYRQLNKIIFVWKMQCLQEKNLTKEKPSGNSARFFSYEFRSANVMIEQAQVMNLLRKRYDMIDHLTNAAKPLITMRSSNIIKRSKSKSLLFSERAQIAPRLFDERRT